MQKVKFRLAYEDYVPGDEAKFSEDEAFEIREAGFGQFVEAKKAKPEKKAESKEKAPKKEVKEE